MKEVAVFAGGCFWCTEAVFKRIKGVEKVQSGFSGGHIKNPAYKEVVTQRTGHAECVYLNYDSEIISYKDLLTIFFATHDPTTLNQQGADKGTHYRSAIFYTTPNQQKEAEDFKEYLTKGNIFEKPIVTELNAFEVFYEAESYHENYYDLNPDQGYCSFVISPKIRKLTEKFNKFLK